MTKKYKGIIITVAVIVGVILASVIFCFTLFTVKDIKLDFRTELTAKYTQTEIIEKSGIENGKCVFFLKKKQHTANLEKNFPYLKVINIEIVIPSHIIIHLAEREEFYAIPYGEKTLICDDEFKVLKIEDGTSYESTASNAILLKKVKITNEKVEAGDFLSFKQDGLEDLYDGMLLNSRNRPQMLALCKEIEISEYAEKEVVVDGNRVEKEMQTSIKITTHNGRKVYIHNITYGLPYKLQKYFALQTSILDVDNFYLDKNNDDKRGQDEDIYSKSEDDDIKKDKMFEILSTCDIHIANFGSEYQYNEDTDKFEKTYSEKDCFYYLEYEGAKLKLAE